MTRKVEVVPYDRDWLDRFKAEAAALSAVLGFEAIAVHHFGSTAIPGISAKPIIDILVEVRDITRIDGYSRQLIELGYRPQAEAGIPGSRFFVKGDDRARTAHMHVVQSGSPEVARHLAFRDYLIAFPGAARAYAHLKEDLARRFPEDIDGYIAGKEAFVKEMESKAMAWRERETVSAHDQGN